MSSKLLIRLLSIGKKKKKIQCIVSTYEDFGMCEHTELAQNYQILQEYFHYWQFATYLKWHTDYIVQIQSV